MSTSDLSAFKTEFAPAERLPKEELLRQHYLWAAHDQTRLICDAVPNLILILNECRQAVYSNKKIKIMENCPGHDCYLGQRPGELFGCIHAFETEGGCGTTSFCRTCGAANAILKGLAGEKDTEECRIDQGSGQSNLNLRVWTSPVVLDKENYVIFTIQDISVEIENRRLFDQVQHLAVHDPLTGVMNRRAFFEAAAHEVNRSLRYHNPFSVEMIDLDDFKAINDTHGHPAGDKLLIEVANRIKSQLRDVDILARYGGDEFIVLLPETGLCGGIKNAKRIREAVEETPIDIGNGEMITQKISNGVAEYDLDEDISIDNVIVRADQALYEEKKKRKAAKNQP